MGKGFYRKVVIGDRGLRGVPLLFNNDENEGNDPWDFMTVAISTSHAAGKANTTQGSILFEPPHIAITRIIVRIVLLRSRRILGSALVILSAPQILWAPQNARDLSQASFPCPISLGLSLTQHDNNSPTTWDRVNEGKMKEKLRVNP